MFVSHYALSEAPRFGDGEASRASVTVGALESLDAYAAMLDALRASRLDLAQPASRVPPRTVIDPPRAASVQHTSKVGSYLPYELAEGTEHWDHVKKEVSK